MPRRIPFYLLNAFTDTPFAGNPAGIFFDDAGALTAGEMQRMAGEVSLESAFVSPPDTAGGAAFRLRYFTGACEVPLCGHATVAALTALRQAGRVGDTASLTLQTNVGALPVTLAPRADNGATVTLFQTPREFGPPITNADELAVLAGALGCAPRDFVSVSANAEGLSPRRVSTGTPWLLVPVLRQENVDAAPGDKNALTQLSRETGTFGVYVFAYGPAEASNFTVWSRCFAPVAGLDEDPVTGSGAGALGYFLRESGALRPGGRVTVQQGFGGGRGGTVAVALAPPIAAGGDGVIAVTGTAVLVAEGTFVLP